MIHLFARHEVPPLETLSGTLVYQLHEKLDRGETLTREEKNQIVALLRDSAHTTFVKRGGYAFDFSEWLTEYWVCFRHVGIEVVYAPDATAIRVTYGPYHTIKIVKVG